MAKTRTAIRRITKTVLMGKRVRVGGGKGPAFLAPGDAHPHPPGSGTVCRGCDPLRARSPDFRLGADFQKPALLVISTFSKPLYCNGSRVVEVESHVRSCLAAAPFPAGSAA